MELVWIRQKTLQDTLHQNCGFASDWIYGSRSIFRCIRGVNRQHTIFHARVGLVRIRQKRALTPYAELMFLHPVGSVGHVVHSGASVTQNGDALFSMLG
jgi:hypothetical protein